MVGERGFEPPTPWSRTRVQEFSEFEEEREGGSFLFSKACKSLYRRRFKEIGDAPFAAYLTALLRLDSSKQFASNSDIAFELSTNRFFSQALPPGIISNCQTSIRTCLAVAISLLAYRALAAASAPKTGETCRLKLF